jgi:hypothetical protein
LCLAKFDSSDSRFDYRTSVVVFSWNSKFELQAHSFKLMSHRTVSGTLDLTGDDNDDDETEVGLGSHEDGVTFTPPSPSATQTTVLASGVSFSAGDKRKLADISRVLDDAAPTLSDDDDNSDGRPVADDAESLALIQRLMKEDADAAEAARLRAEADAVLAVELAQHATQNDDDGDDDGGARNGPGIVDEDELLARKLASEPDVPLVRSSASKLRRSSASGLPVSAMPPPPPPVKSSAAVLDLDDDDYKLALQLQAEEEAAAAARRASAAAASSSSSSAVAAAAAASASAAAAAPGGTPLMSKLLKIGSATVAMEFPEFWEDMGTKRAITVTVPNGGSEWVMIENEFSVAQREAPIWGMSGAGKGAHLPRLEVVKIERLQNVDLWKWYHLYREDLKSRVGADKVNERLLFHAAKNEKLTKTIVAEGFDMRLANESGSIGAGLYLAPSPQTSRCYTVPLRDGTKQMFLAMAVLGRVSAAPDASRRRPPKNFDSVGSESSGQYAVYDNRAVYPAYLITFTESGAAGAGAFGAGAFGFASKKAMKRARVGAFAPPSGWGPAVMGAMGAMAPRFGFGFGGGAFGFGGFGGGGGGGGGGGYDEDEDEDEDDEDDDGEGEHS